MFLFAKAPDFAHRFSNSYSTWGAALAGLNLVRKGSSGGSVPSEQEIWVDLTENRQMVLESYRAENRD